MEQRENRIFAFDIGTRSVVGVVLEVVQTQDGLTYKLIGTEMEEHQVRSMLDGQIHHVGEVAKVITHVKEKMEKKYGPFQEVAVAAAGRSLKTTRAKFRKEIKGEPPLDEERILALELAAVQQAQYSLAKEGNGERAHYYCVGYSLLSMSIDGMKIGHLLDQQGEAAEVEILATFLPRIVVDNLLAALQRAGLTMSALTLEPIAAIHVLIPPTMRRLNLALVDIGAGTSDIAITAEGTVVAYGMVPIAGDEITDGLAEKHLLDFPIAEEVKRSLAEQEKISFTDVLGVSYTLSRKDLLQSIDKEIGRQVDAIAERIIELNGKPPQAAILIGGGSLLPTLDTRLAEALGIPTARVAVRGADAIPSVQWKSRKKMGPEMVTPIGIAVASVEHPVRYLSITVNEKQVRLFDLRRLTIGDAAMAAGIDLKRLHGRPGLACSILVNGRLRLFPGSHGNPPSILLNEKKASLGSEIKDGDRITITPGADGEPPVLHGKDVLQEIGTLDILLNGEPLSIPPILTVNGSEADLMVRLQDRDEVKIGLPSTLETLLPHIAERISLLLPLEEEITFTLNGEPQRRKIRETKITVNGIAANPGTRLHQGDRVTVKQKERHLTLRDLLPLEKENLSLHIHFNGAPVDIPIVKRKIGINGEITREMERTIGNGDVISIHSESLLEPRFKDVFRYIEYTLPSIASHQKAALYRNGETVDLDEPLHEGDRLEIRILSMDELPHTNH